MADYRTLERQITEAFGLDRRPVGDLRPQRARGVHKFSGTEPAGCSFWRLAERGDVFYTEPGDHYNCAVGCFTHSIALPAERASERDQTLTFMMQLGYMKQEDLMHITQLRETPRFVTCAPLGEAPVTPDVVLFAGKPSQHHVVERSGAARRSRDEVREPRQANLHGAARYPRRSSAELP